MIRVDAAGNVSKRFGGGIISFARSGGGCARWNLYDAISTPERYRVDAHELPDGMKFLSIARGQISEAPTGQPPVVHAIVLGCEWSHAGRIVHADTLTGADPSPVGITCRLCDRDDCAQRAFPPLNRKLEMDPHLLGASPYGFGDS